MNGKKLLCLVAVMSLLMAVALPVIGASVPAADLSVGLRQAEILTPKAGTATALPDADVIFASNGSNTVLKMTGSDYICAQIVFTDDVSGLWIGVSGKGRVSVSLYEFDTDVGTSLISLPVVTETFDVPDKAACLSLDFTQSPHLPAGEYVAVIYGADGVSLLSRKSAGSQRMFSNGNLTEGSAVLIGATYVGSPSSLYGKPTVPEQNTEFDMAPHAASALRYDKETGPSLISSANTMKVSYMTEDGVGFTRLSPATDADDPFGWMPLEGSPKTSEYKYLLMRCRIDEGCPRRGQFFVVTDANASQVPWANTFFDYADTTDWQNVIVKLEGLGLYSGLVQSVRLDPVDHMSGTHTIDVAYIALFKTAEAAKQFDGDFSAYEPETETVPVETQPDYGSYTSQDEPAPSTDGKLRENGVLPYKYKTYTHTADFSGTVDGYHAGKEFGFFNLDNAVIKDGRLYNQAFKPTSVFTRQTVGDPYGVRGGEFSFDTVLIYGSITVTLREVMANDESKYSGIRFTLSADGYLNVTDRDGFTCDFDTGLDLTEERHLVFRDAVDRLELVCDGEVKASIAYDPVARTISDGDTTASAPHMPAAGYAAITLNGIIGYVDNLSYTSTDIVANTASADTVPVDYSTWVATDDLGRVTPTAVSVDGQKYVGLFYFMFHSYFSGRDVHDVTALYLKGGAEGVKKTLSGWAGRDGAYWAEPYFGYYSSNDVWVFRKHAAMLDAAGVDFIFLDLSNGSYFPEQIQILCDTWLNVRKQGGHTPQIAFMFGDMPSVFVSGVQTLLPIWNNPDYQELFFKWEGKPLILGNNDGTQASKGRYKVWTCSDTTPQTTSQYKNYLEENPSLKSFVENEINGILENFTVRKCWAWQTTEKRVGYWDWLQDSPQNPGRGFDGTVEQMAVSIGTHAHTNKGRSLLNEDTSYNTLGEFGYTLGTAQYGYHFAEQFEYAIAQNVSVIMITGWNEWYAGVQSTSNSQQICGGTQTPGFYMVDQMSPEYSRDAEPMRIRDGVGFGDNYYYQMVSYIRQFKGITAPDTVNGGDMDIHAEDVAAQWAGVLPLYTDTVGDCAYRNELSFTSEYRYVNGTARNDIATSQVTQSDGKLYFYVTTVNKLAVVDDSVWMNLYVNADGDTGTGWEGYDFLINRSRTDTTVSVEAFRDGQWAFVSVGNAEYRVTENGLMIAIDKTLLGAENGTVMSFTFKWADNADIGGDVMEFMELGDAAPNDRFAFNAVFTSNADQRPEPEVETDVPDDTDTEDSTGTSGSEPAADTEIPGDADATEQPGSGTESTATADNKGCGSFVGVSWIIGVLACGAALLIPKRKGTHNS